MKNYVLKTILSCTIILFLFACEKDSEFFTADDPLITQTSPYAFQAEELLSQLSPEGLEILTSEDIEEFKRGPEVTVRSQNQQYGSWHPVLGLFFCEAAESSTYGEGLWLGYGMSTLEIDRVPDPTEGFEDGHFTLTSAAQAKLMGPYVAKRAHRWGHHRIMQKLKGTFETGTQIFFMPDGRMKMNVVMPQQGNADMMVLIRGWVYYGLADPPVPLAFEPNYPTEVLEQHYIDLKTIPGAEAMYIETFNTFWTYPTITDGLLAAPGIGMGPWHDHGEVTFVVDQGITPATESAAGRWRLYTGVGSDYQASEYMDFCHTMTFTPTGGIWPFDMVGGSEAFFNYGGKGTGVWLGLSNIPFANVPDPALFPPDLFDNGFSCTPYGSNDCPSCPIGPGGNTQVYIIGYRYALSSSNCFSVDLNQTGHPLAGSHTIDLPDGKSFTGFGAAPLEVTLGAYTGLMQSVVIGEELAGSVIHYQLVHYFYDSDGNSFWTSDFAVATPIDAVTVDINDKMTVVGGTGDFECARGMFRNIAVMHLDSFTLDYHLTGNICSGCE
jgi:hypothetical protein